MSHGKRKLKSNVNSMSLFQKDTHIHTTSLRTTRGREGGAGAGRFCRPRGQKPGWVQTTGAEAGVGAESVGREGMGWSRPAQAALPTNLAKSKRRGLDGS